MSSGSGDVLTSFAKLGPSVYLQDPVVPTGDDARPLIFIAFWMNAPPGALAKYVVEYRKAVPSARIVFVCTSSNDFLLRGTSSRQQARLATAVEAIRAFVSSKQPVFMHLFSNGGVSSTTHLLQAYHRAVGAPLPVSFMIMDSAPGNANILGAVRAYSYALPRMWILRFIGIGCLWIVMLFIKIFHMITRTSDPISRSRKVINDASLIRAVNPKAVPTRCYIYSDTDDLVSWQDVERHASESEALGWAVRCEKFRGTPHVGHMRVDPARYWAIVKTYLELAGHA